MVTCRIASSSGSSAAWVQLATTWSSSRARAASARSANSCPSGCSRTRARRPSEGSGSRRASPAASSWSTTRTAREWVTRSAPASTSTDRPSAHSCSDTSAAGRPPAIPVARLGRLADAVAQREAQRHRGDSPRARYVPRACNKANRSPKTAASGQLVLIALGSAGHEGRHQPEGTADHERCPGSRHAGEADDDYKYARDRERDDQLLQPDKAVIPLLEDGGGCSLGLTLQPVPDCMQPSLVAAGFPGEAPHREHGPGRPQRPRMSSETAFDAMPSPSTMAPDSPSTRWVSGQRLRDVADDLRRLGGVVEDARDQDLRQEDGVDVRGRRLGVRDRVRERHAEQREADDARRGEHRQRAPVARPARRRAGSARPGSRSPAAARRWPRRWRRARRGRRDVGSGVPRRRLRIPRSRSVVRL